MKVQKSSSDSILPARATDGAGAYDCYADMDAELYPGESQKIMLGFRAEVPAGHVAMLVPRSSTGSRGMHLKNVVGVCDSDYCGVFIANVVNNSEDWMKIRRGERICQMLIVPVALPELEVVDELTPTERGDNGFGSTGSR
jgi:dUTP pyrophosphatase